MARDLELRIFEKTQSVKKSLNEHHLCCKAQVKMEIREFAVNSTHFASSKVSKTASGSYIREGRALCFPVVNIPKNIRQIAALR